MLGMLATTLSAADSDNSISATLLYLKPNVDDTHFVLSSFDNTFQGSLFPKGKRHQNCTSFTPGVSLEGFYTICPGISSLDFQATCFNAHSTHSVSGDFLYDTNGFPGFGAQASPVYKGTARSKNSYHYYAGDFTYNRILLHNLTLLIGLHGAYIKFKEHTTSLGTFTNNDQVLPLSNNLHRNSQFWGIGPQIGLDYQLSLTCRWSLKAKATGALLCGNTKSDLRYITLRTGPGGVGVRNGDLWRITSAANADLGMNYALNCKCFNLTVQFGYEFILYHSCVNKITGVDVFFTGDMIDVFNTFSLHGPYLKMTTNF